MTAKPRRWTKHYPDSPDGTARCRTAAAHHAWLASLGAPVPRLLVAHPHKLEFEHIAGVHARPQDLPALACLLGDLHRVAYEHELHRARLDRPHHTTTGVTIPDFVSHRRIAIIRLLTQRAVPEPALSLSDAMNALDETLAGPAAFYKDSNPRNFLISTNGPVLVDFDTVTLAPLGYDLAKLIVTLAMTHGPIPDHQIRTALTTYNTALTHAIRELQPVPWKTLMTWAAIHHVLTSPYLGRGGYRHRWTAHQP
ncbi:hypothetical protein Arub01_56990 [Actinomadura rubrobrunea]|uniref:Aminoglycoside phosphotransferase domain-containing protein n=1 Tax=Actinomadura rubrobrunea TaxID=115335 RepID=A0A9W6UX96_9ACTN|nr:phosphotransferase [Actinomadura rubrobrunea]GLW67456.1 hypothetical protein Arub01_56990 [Actinomadura rubrobrunea]